MKRKRVSACRLHLAEDFQAHPIPTQLPSKNCGQHNDEKPVGNVRNGGKTRLKAFLHFPEKVSDAAAEGPINAFLNNIIMPKLIPATAEVIPEAWVIFPSKKRSLTTLLP